MLQQAPARTAASFLLAFLLAVVVLSSNAVAEQSIMAGANDLAITDGMALKTLEEMKGNCDIIISAFVYDPTSPLPNKWVPLYIYGAPPFAPQISREMVGKGLQIVSAQPCTLAVPTTLSYLQKSSRLSTGWNFIGVSAGMTSRTFTQLKGSCQIDKIRRYAGQPCQSGCDGDFIIINPDTQLDPAYAGKGLWVKVWSDCTLNDGTPFSVLCDDKDCAFKNGCDSVKYRTYACRNKECTAITERDCTEQERTQRPNLVPILAKVSPPLFQSTTLPVTISHVEVTIRNAGNADGIASGTTSGTLGGAFENKASIRKNNVEICGFYGRNALTFPAGRDVTLPLPLKQDGFRGDCVINDVSAIYTLVVDVDTLALSYGVGIVQESVETDNRLALQIYPFGTALPCSPLAARVGDSYCSLTGGIFQPQKEAFATCSHNFECRSELCLDARCVSDQNKEKLRRIIAGTCTAAC